MSIQIKNPNIAELEIDHYYHIGFNSGQDLAGMFGDVKLVIFGGANDRMKKIAQIITKEFFPDQDPEAVAPIGDTSRYNMFKVGPIITCSHQMGQASFSILLHEMSKMLAAAKAIDPVFIRLGTCGGIDVAPGTVVMTTTGFNNRLKPYYKFIAAGKAVKRDAIFPEEIYNKLSELAEELGLPNAQGGTLCCDDFYEGQGRLDGAICEHSLEDKMEFLHQAKDLGVVNIEMESCFFGAFCKHLNIKCGTICVTLVRRLDGDQVTGNVHDFVERPIAVMMRYIEKVLGLPRVTQ